jgi:pentatricopeptide repeat protein
MALEINSDDRYALTGLGDIYGREGKYERALEYLEKLIVLGVSKTICVP